MIVLLAAGTAGSAGAAQKLNPYSIQGQFICTGCHEPLNQVNSPESQAEKRTLVQLTGEGLDLSQIKAQMVKAYGVAVLARPPARGLNLLIYILPPLVLLGGLGFLAYSLPRWRRRARQAARVGPLVAMPLDPADEARLDEELSGFDA
jgi:cytochrome c-type biogenesis protein CcmH